MDSAVITFLGDVSLATWDIIRESALYILFGFVMAGIIKGFMPVDKIIAYLRPRNLRSIVNAALIGIPLPLCSCGVLPAAAALRKEGASKGATSAFLIATPETGVDSVAVTYALMDPVMTIFRPIAAFITAAVAGLSENLFGHDDEGEAKTATCGSCCSGDAAAAIPSASLMERLKRSTRYAFQDLMDDMAGWIAVGFVIAGLITTLMPDDFLLKFSDSVFFSMVVMLAAGIPLYICATASTPIAAVLILKGLNPGAALVFLLTGPATNAVAITLLLKLMGRRSVVIYLLSIAVSSILLGYALNGVYALSGINATVLGSHYSEITPPLLEAGMAIVLIFFMARSVLRGRGFSAG